MLIQIFISTCSYVAVCEDRKGNEIYTVSVLASENGKVHRLSDQIPNCSGSIAWADDHTIFYVTQDPTTLRPHKVGGLF